MKETREIMWEGLMQYYGLKEIPGKGHNATILLWWKLLGYDWIKDDETSWCSLTMSVIAKLNNIEYSKTLDARSWMKIGKPVLEPKLGHLVVFYRGNGWQGHVGLYAGHTGKNEVVSFGGNQANQINFYPYPVKSESFGVLGFRELDFIK
jgi:uncharacterized protein (TIGR02594 family)